MDVDVVTGLERAHGYALVSSFKRILFAQVRLKEGI